MKPGAAWARFERKPIQRLLCSTVLLALMGWAAAQTMFGTAGLQRPCRFVCNAASDLAPLGRIAHHDKKGLL
ncbi:MAG TPA: hypothetical protein PLM14_15110 [Candidatus Hydrogenedentes bacterium]|nr:hypothetical protein [Candidatus Hydrogenedentota bacterium]HQH54074.1 hypothetical protein [Candidatus Hydrogenedentota bacterium]